MLEIRMSKPGDAEYVAAHLREEDRNEILALGLPPEAAVKGSVAGSDVSYTALLDGVPVMVFGVNLPDWKNIGEIWALGTPGCNKIAKSMVQRTKGILGKLLAICPVMENWCDARYKKSIQWLRMLGFTVGAPAPYGVNGELFCHITIRRADICA
jgi:hypothetical protein